MAYCGFSVSGIIILYLFTPETVSVGPDKHTLIWVDILRRVHDVGFLVERLILTLCLLVRAGDKKMGLNIIYNLR